MISVNSSFAKLIDDDQFELLNINANDIYYFDEITLKLPDDLTQKILMI